MNKKLSFDPSFPTRKDHFKAWCNSLFIDHSIFRLIWSNFETVIPGKVYRCNHPTPSRLTYLTQKFHLKTLINLRGHRACGSDALSRRKSQELNLTHLDMAFESRGAPHKDRILRFAQIYKNLEFPILIHCKSGADRAGLVSAIIILLENGRVEQAMQQLSWKYGHFKQAKTGILDAFFIKFYQETNGKMNFLEWVKDCYSEDALRNKFQQKTIASFVTDKILRRE